RESFFELDQKLSIFYDPARARLARRPGERGIRASLPPMIAPSRGPVTCPIGDLGPHHVLEQSRKLVLVVKSVLARVEVEKEPAEDGLEHVALLDDAAQPRIKDREPDLPTDRPLVLLDQSPGGLRVAAAGAGEEVGKGEAPHSR